MCITPRLFREHVGVENNINDYETVSKSDQNKITINNNVPFVGSVVFSHNSVKENRLHKKKRPLYHTRVSECRCFLFFFFRKLKTGRYFYDFRLRLLRLLRLQAIGASIQLYYIILSSMSFPVLITASPVEQISKNNRHYSLYYGIVDKTIFLSAQMKTRKYNNLFFNNRKKSIYYCNIILLWIKMYLIALELNFITFIRTKNLYKTKKNTITKL